MRPEALFALSWALYRLQLSTAQIATAFATALWWAAMRELWLLWLPPKVAQRRPGPSLAEMVRETRQDTFHSDEEGSPR